MEALNFAAEVINDEGAVLLHVDGYVDTTTANSLERALDERIDDGAPIVLIELSKVDYVSSAGWGVFVSSVRRARERGSDLRLIGMQSEVRDVYELLEFPSILTAHHTTEEALATLSV